MKIPYPNIQKSASKAVEFEVQKTLQIRPLFYCQKRSEMMILAIVVLIASTAAIAVVIYVAGICLCQMATIFVNH